jgi:hypothetical protein
VRLLLEGEAPRLAAIAKGASLVRELETINANMQAQVPAEDIKGYLKESDVPFLYQPMQWKRRSRRSLIEEHVKRHGSATLLIFQITY